MAETTTKASFRTPERRLAVPHLPRHALLERQIAIQDEPRDPFRHERAKDAHAPGYYLHIGPGEVFAGGGIWQPATEAATAIREAIAEDPERWRHATQSGAFARRLQLGSAATRSSASRHCSHSGNAQKRKRAPPL
jgi:hypothetical protein